MKGLGYDEHSSGIKHPQKLSPHEKEDTRSVVARSSYASQRVAMNSRLRSLAPACCTFQVKKAMTPQLYGLCRQSHRLNRREGTGSVVLRGCAFHSKRAQVGEQ